MLSKAGIQIEVEHRRALQGLSIYNYTFCILSLEAATAYLRHSMFEEYTFTAPTGGEGSDEEEGEKSVEFDINLGILNETLSIYGTSTGTSTGTGKRRKWKAGRQGDEDDDQPHGTLDNFFKPFGRTKTTSMRMSYDGDGHPLKLLLYVKSLKIRTGLLMLQDEVPNEPKVQLRHVSFIRCYQNG